MILDAVSRLDRYAALNPLFLRAAEDVYKRQHQGEADAQGDRQRYDEETKDQQDDRLRSVRRYRSEGQKFLCDVYDRQRIGLCDSGGQYLSVSYTHLDVYKRQG